MVLLCDQHRLQSVQGALLLLVGNKHTALLAIKSSIDTGHSAEFAEDVPNVGLAQALVIDKGNGEVPELVSLDIRGWGQA